jgi:hypothetical protein
MVPQQAGRPLTPAEKKQYLLAKYTKRDYNVGDLESCKKYAVYFCPNLELVKEWKLLHVCGNLNEAKQQIFWRKQYMSTKDGDLIIDNCEDFKTWRDETKNVDSNGNAYEPGEELMKIDYNAPGNMIQVIASSTPAQQNSNGFKGFGFYTGIEIGNYQGFYKIEEIYEV